MKFSWKIAAPILCLTVICCAALAWKFYEKRKADELKLVEAAKACRISAEQGDAQAQYKLGYMYSHGQGLPQDYAEAFYWFSKSADQGNAMGENGLASMYLIGRGVAQDYAEALRLYQKAADQGYAKAQYNLGKMYYYGEGVLQSNAEAALWYRKAAEQGDVYAQSNLGYMYSCGYGVQRDRAEADRWYHKAADQGDEYAQRALGMRVPAPKKLTKYSYLLSFLAGLFLLSDYLLSKRRLRKPRQVNELFAGVLCLFSVAWRFLGSIFIDMLHSKLAVCSFYFIESLIGGILVVSLLSIVIPRYSWYKTAKIAFGVFIAIFVINNGFLIFLFHKYHAVPGNCLIYKTNGNPIGAIVFLMIYLFRLHKNPGERINNSGDEMAENSVDSEDEQNPENEERSDAYENTFRPN
ncbi:MAG: tetratricopeptide repeat protein [Terracidiphilus sp.]